MKPELHFLVGGGQQKSALALAWLGKEIIKFYTDCLDLKTWQVLTKFWDLFVQSMNQYQRIKCESKKLNIFISKEGFDICTL